MSRCFSFPPPGYLRNTDTLIEESIKIQLDTEKPNKDRTEKKDKKDRNETKEERKLRKEKKRERKEKRKREKEETKKDSKLKLADEVKKPKDNGKLQKGQYYENEHVEKSDITEELDKPVSSPQEPSSSDSSQSSKRKRDTLLSSKDHGTGIRIRLPLRKHTEPEEVKQVFQLGSSSRSVGISDSITQETRRVQRPLQGVTKVENTNQLPVNSASCRLPLKKVETPNELAGISAPQVSRPLLKKVETHSSSQVCRPPQKKVETHSSSQVCRPTQKKVETLLSGNSASQVCRPPLKKVETLLPGNSAPKVCRPPLRKDETPSQFNASSASKVCRPPLRKDETPCQLNVSSASKVCRPPLSKDETLNQLNVNSASNVCKALSNSVPVDAPSKPLKNLVPVDAPTANETVDKESRRMESLYNSLLNIPPIKYDCFDSVDEDWLFRTESVSKKQKIDDAIQCSKSVWPPRAQYMPEIEMYALPYTVPF
ncbi:uncharacterized protein LOC131596686 [Vicia villosa]|uniref:uncharacterized protein LOC131596686 n=1 Tax=Vicia villosa TaxID=3911 RepID=UPI00273BFE83|nr:uncharacterized protein LOC131596686 [Vicia villosa]